jgi:hypothetical protein
VQSRAVALQAKTAAAADFFFHGVGSRTDLCVYELRQGSNELWCRVQIVREESVVDELAN